MKLILLAAVLLASTVLRAAEPTVEEMRVDKARAAMEKVVGRWRVETAALARDWSTASNYEVARKMVRNYGQWLWGESKKAIHKNGDYDDRPAYWTRLQMSQLIRSKEPAFKVSDRQRNELLELLEETSRGRYDLEYVTDAPLRILVTGFDPFLLDRNIEQGNPSGIAGLLLDDQIIEYQGRRAEINAVLFPVRFEDFDRGELETLLAPFYALNSVDMVVTISQGRSDFDLERFPGRRRSSQAPDNVNLRCGGGANKPVISNVGKYGLSGPEFVEFSLPSELMQKVTGQYKVNDNHNVTTLEKGNIAPDRLTELAASTAVQGSGGGYLSNEISYRSIRLRNLLGSKIPTGHIHTPVLKASTPEQAKPIIDQIRAMLERALPAL